MKKRKICVVITARASYSRIKSALVAIKNHEGLELNLVVAASALLDRYGSAYEVIERDGFKIDAKVYNVVESGNLIGQAKTTGLGIIELSNVFNSEQPDMVVTIADRYETMSTAIAASYMNIPLVHIQGGEVTGNIDEKVRHAITKLADLHLVSTEKAKERVIKMGENEAAVFVTGCPSIDLALSALSSSALTFDPYKKYRGVGKSPDYSSGYLVVMQHPVTTEYELARKHIEETLEAITALSLPTFWFWPNVDGGSDSTSKGIRSYRERMDVSNIHFFKNMDPEDFLIFIRNSKCLIGNSSVGIRECSYLGVPTVNIGSRQFGRERGENVIDTGYSSHEIQQAVNKHLSNGMYPSDSLYGVGDAGNRIADIIATAKITSSKHLSY